MSTSIHMSLLALLILSFSSSTFADCPTRLSFMPLLQNLINSNISNINILYLQVSNDLPPYTQWPDRFYFIGTDQPAPCDVHRGQPFGHVYNSNYREYDLISGQKNISAVVYDPKVDLGHNNVYWSVRADGAYKSYDNVNWTKYGSWRNSSV